MSFEKIIMSNTMDSSFVNQFDKYWNDKLDQLDSTLILNKQLIHGSRMRPILAAWGYFMNCNDETHIPLELLELCFSLELLHKSSIIIDDLIDNDERRKGEKTFHAEFGEHKAVLFAISLIGKSFENIYSINSNYSSLFGKELAITLTDMSSGALQELSLNQRDILDIKKIDMIIHKETTTLIQNSLHLGFSLSSVNENAKLAAIVENIGYFCGYLFQILNDLEPFMSTQINKKYKGRTNFDIENNRKNHIVAFLYGNASSSDREIIQKIINKEGSLSSPQTLLQLIEKYSICEKVLERAEEIQTKIFSEISLLDNHIVSSQYVFDFSEFVKRMIKTSYLKLGINQ